ncbi:zinc-dependent metalloprotease [Candidatus Poriferisocius sp.]|uniref:zinc-dependent metalloprotease n=1 Tax=Candidatus Poriferisocius sp. TaxID=3101276 RepID=UPI003B01207F
MVTPVEPVDWKLAERVAKRVGGHEPFLDSYHYRNLAPELTDLTAEAEGLVAAETGIRSMSGAGRARVTTRAGWVEVNVASFQRLLRPITHKMAERVSHSWFTPVARGVSGTELGAVLGWMSTRVLGQYDLLITEDDRPEDQDILYYVGPNVMALEHKYGFDPHQFRLWLALHETTHRAQFTGIEWLRPHFLSLVEEALDAAEPDLEHFRTVARQVIQARRKGEDPLADGGLPALLATPEQKAVLDRIGGMMSLLEGHGDITMDRAGAARIPDARRFARVLRHRRNSATGLAKLVQRIIGIEAKLNQYAAGEAFIETVEVHAGPDFLNRVWESADRLPTMTEIRSPQKWIDRISSIPTPAA